MIVHAVMVIKGCSHAVLEGRIVGPLLRQDPDPMFPDPHGRILDPSLDGHTRRPSFTTLQYHVLHDVLSWQGDHEATGNACVKRIPPP